MIARLIRIAAVAILALPLQAQAFEHPPYELELLVDGASLEGLPARGKTYVEALRGREYSIRLTNHTAEQIAVALSVDGLNTIDAKRTAATAASKWILGPFASVTLDGWQTGPDTARRFFFTTEEESYGAWLGRTENLGLISAAVFRAKRPVHKYVRSDAPAAPQSRSAAEAAPEELAATGMGREVDHGVRAVAFDAEASPTVVLELRYEYREALVRLGVLPRPDSCLESALDRRERARGFEGFAFAPEIP